MRRIHLPRRVYSGGITRRQALRQIGVAAGATAFAPWAIGCGDDHGRPLSTPTPNATSTPASTFTGTATPTPTSTLTGTPTTSSTPTPTSTPTASPTPLPLRPEELNIETVVVVMMENRSFDHYFGSLSLEEGRAIDGLRAGFSNPMPNGTPVPIFPTDRRCVADPPHSWERSHAQFNGGANDGFVREYHASLISDGYTAAEADQLANQVMGYQRRANIPILYALADEFVLCQQWFCSLLGPTWPNRMYLHSAQSGGRMTNDFPEDLQTGFTWPTIYDRLTAAGIEWKTYFTDLTFLPLWGSLRTPGTAVPITQFVDDALSGNLPPVCHIEPGFLDAAASDDHPPHDIMRGEAFLSTVLHALGQGPQWSRTLVIITYDEHGGFFDHVAPPVVDDERSAAGFGQLGVRVPGLMISPYSPRGVVSSTLYEHSSVPAFIEWLFGLEPLTVRDAQSNMLSDLLDLDRIRRRDPRPFPSLPVIEIDPDDVPSDCAPFRSAPAAAELARLADSGAIPASFDRRRESVELVRSFYSELIRMGGARLRRGRSR